MLLRETIHKTKVVFHKSLRNFKSFFLGGYKKLPRSLSFNPFLGRSGNARTYTSDQFYNEFYDILQSDLNSRCLQTQSTQTKSKNWSRGSPMRNSEAVSVSTGTRSNVSFAKQNTQKSIPKYGVLKENKNKGNCQVGKKGDLDSKNKIEGGKVLAQKMKELEMMESGDIEHELDIEEALHYYSRLSSPVYLGIVDKFFMDMHSEFSLPQSSVKVKGKKNLLNHKL
ncbi:hypothetical protein TanjilG_30094 [Lupinus angustifolius]|uniref:OVATE domain-containing protein n=1 Tax=Lupinus angustifolius TaxID=3871 RepID=A0A4P1R704_LUPAN|nr:PREDICTED: uncharacterized protein LOC109358485 [Lupinus angustifolius]OIW03818.1 hypothetical protein TanjilG_30094 [Lupinus angustifolius]